MENLILITLTELVKRTDKMENEYNTRIKTLEEENKKIKELLSDITCFTHELTEFKYDNNQALRALIDLLEGYIKISSYEFRDKYINIPELKRIKKYTIEEYRKNTFK